jgi:hypothetical protein
MSFRTGTPVVGSHAGQRQVGSETVHRDAVARSATGVSDGRLSDPSPGDRAAGRAARDAAEGASLRLDARRATTVAAMVGDAVTAAVTLNDRGDILAVSYPTGSRDLLVRHGPSGKQRKHSGPVMTTPLAEQRRDLHNTSINFDLAVAGRCGFTHIPSGRVCQLPYRHPGPCNLRYLAPSATPTVAGLGQNPTDSAPLTATERRSVTTRNVTRTRGEEQI